MHYYCRFSIFLELADVTMSKFSLKSLFGNSSDSSDSSESSVDEEDTIDLPTSCIDEEVAYTSPCITIKMAQNKVKGIAHQLWPAATFLCNFIESNKTHASISSLFSEKKVNVLELGAGIGLCGIHAASLLSCNHVFITDLPEAIGGIEKNIELNAENIKTFSNGDQVRVSARVLDWMDTTSMQPIIDEIRSSQAVQSCSDTLNSSSIGDHSPTAMQTYGSLDTVVLAADCVYHEYLFQPLCDTLLVLTSLGCHVLLCHVRRWKRDGKFFKLCKKAGMTVKLIHEDVSRETDDSGCMDGDAKDRTDSSSRSMLSADAPGARLVTRIYDIYCD